MQKLYIISITNIKHFKIINIIQLILNGNKITKHQRMFDSKRINENLINTIHCDFNITNSHFAQS